MKCSGILDQLEQANLVQCYLNASMCVTVAKEMF